MKVSLPPHSQLLTELDQKQAKRIFDTLRAEANFLPDVPKKLLNELIQYFKVLSFYK